MCCWNLEYQRHYRDKAASFATFVQVFVHLTYVKSKRSDSCGSQVLQRIKQLGSSEKYVDSCVGWLMGVGFRMFSSLLKQVKF